MSPLHHQAPRSVPWVDPIKPGWPGPRREWTPEMVDTFERAFESLLARGYPDQTAYAEAWGEVVRMPEGRRTAR